MAVSLEEKSYNEDAFDIHHGQLGQTEPMFCSFCGNSNVVNGQERFSLCSDRTTTSALVTLTPNTGTVRAEEMHLQSKLRIQRLEHQLYEEQVNHLIKVKELSSQLATIPGDIKELSSVTTSASSCNFVGGNNRMPILSPLEVELTKKLESMRIQHQIEEEEAIHKIKMRRLNDS